MPRATTGGQFRDLLNFRRLLNVPSPQWAANVFTLEGLILNGAVTSSDLTTQDAWFADEQVRGAYACVDGATTKLKATLHMEWYALQFSSGAFAAITAAVKDNLFTTGTAPYLEANVGGTVRKFGLCNHMRQNNFIDFPALAAGAQAEVAHIEGKPHILASPVEINLENDTFTLKSDAAVALGADTPVRVIIGGLLIPSTVVPTGAIPGGTCTFDAAENGRAASPAELQLFTAQSAQLAALVRAF